MKQPNYTLEAIREPGSNDFNVSVKNGEKVETKKLALTQLQDEISDSLTHHPSNKDFVAILHPALDITPCALKHNPED